MKRAAAPSPRFRSSKRRKATSRRIFRPTSSPSPTARSSLVTDLFNKGVRPAIDVGISVSRVGSSAQTKATKAVAGGLKLELAQFRDLEAFTQFAQDLDKTTADQLASGARMIELLKQKNGAPIPMEWQVAMLYAASLKLFAEVPIARVREAAALFVDFGRCAIQERARRDQEIRQLSDDSKKSLAKATEEFRLAHPELFAAK